MADRIDPTISVGLVTETGPGRPLPPPRACILHVVWWTAVFLGTCLAIGAALPPTPKAWTTPKLEYFEAHKDEYDVVFLGSSQIYRHVDPVRFDELMAAAGHPVRSFNFGVAAMAALECRYVLGEVLSMRPERLKWIVTDVQRMGVLLAGENHITPRATSWHDVPSTLLALRLVLETDMDLEWRIDGVRRHLVSFGYRLGNLGRVRQLVEPHLEGTSESREHDEHYWRVSGPGGYGERGDGWVSLNQAYREAEGDQQWMLRQRAKGWQEVREAAMARLLANPDRPRPILSYSGKPRRPQELSPTERKIMADLIEIPRAAGVEPVFINAPDIAQKEFMYERALAEGIIPVLLDLDDPVRYPPLVDPDLRFDETHLNERGARLYTEILARLFIESIEGGDS